MFTASGLFTYYTYAQKDSFNDYMNTLMYAF